MTKYTKLFTSPAYLAAILIAATSSITALHTSPRAEPSATSTNIVISRDLNALPAKTRETLERIKAAAQTGDVEELRSATEWNELPPEIDGDEKDDPVMHWKNISADGSALDVMAEMLNIFDRAYAVRTYPGGGKSYIWPYLAEKSIKELSPSEEVDLYRLAIPDNIKTMKLSGTYSGHVAIIGEDGTWHSYMKNK